MDKQTRHSYEFGTFRLDPAAHVLLSHERSVPLPPKAFDTLVLLVQQSGRLVRKEEFLRTIWPDSFVEENNLTQCISVLRRVLANGEGSPVIETVPRLGYRFVAEVRKIRSRDAEFSNAASHEQEVSVGEFSGAANGKQEPAIGAGVIPPSSARRFIPGWKTALPLVLVAIALAASLAALWISRRVEAHTIQTAGAGRFQTLAVLPFRLLDTADANDFLGFVLADDMIHQMGRNKRVKTLPITAVYKFKDLDTDVLTAGRRLGVEMVVAGQLERSNERIRVDVQLLKTSDGTSLWKKSFEDSSKNILAVQDAIAVSLDQVLGAGPRNSHPPVKRYTTNIEAYEAYLHGRYLWNNRTSEGLYKSIDYFEKAISLDPGFALAYAGLADACAFDTMKWPRGEAAANKALEIDNTLGEAHASLGFIRMFWQRDWNQAQREFKLAIDLKPDYATAHQWYAILLAARTRLPEAILEMREALNLDPYSLPINADLGQMLYFNHEYDLAIQQCRKALALDPTFINAHVYLYDIYSKKKMGANAVEEYFAVQKLLGGNIGWSPVAEQSLRKAYNTSGLQGFWKARVAALKKYDSGAYVIDGVALVEHLMRLGRKEEALDTLNRISTTSQFVGFDLVFAAVNPVYDDLHGDPRFLDIVRRVTPY